MTSLSLLAGRTVPPSQDTVSGQYRPAVICSLGLQGKEGSDPKLDSQVKISMFLRVNFGLNMCFGCSKEPSHAFKYPRHVFWLRKEEKYSKTYVRRPHSKRPKIGFQDKLSLNAGQTYSRMLQGEHSAILSTFIKLPFVIKIFVLSIFEWPFYTCFTVHFLLNTL